MKILFFIILSIVSTCTVYSQDFGVQAGMRLNTSGIEYPGVDVGHKAGFEGGVFYKHSLGILPLNIRTGILYFNNRFNLKSDMGNNVGITYHFEENSLRLPLTVEWKPLPTRIVPFLQAGFYASYSLSGDIKDSDSNRSLKYRKGGHRIDYGAIVGIGVYLTSHIALNANYEYGFAERDLVLGDQFVSVSNRACSVAVNYLF